MIDHDWEKIGSVFSSVQTLWVSRPQPKFWQKIPKKMTEFGLQGLSPFECLDNNFQGNLSLCEGFNYKALVACRKGKIKGTFLFSLTILQN